MQEDQNDEVWIRRMKRLTTKVAEAAGSLLSRHGSRVKDLARQVGGTLLALHIDPKRKKRFYGDRCDVNGWQDLVKVAAEGVSVEIRIGGNLQQELAYGNHRNVQKYRGEVLRKVMADV